MSGQYTGGMLSDTSPEMERVWVGLWREKTVAFRCARAFALTGDVIRRSRQALARARPELSQRERDLVWVGLHYGADLEHRVREHLQQREAVDVDAR